MVAQPRDKRARLWPRDDFDWYQEPERVTDDLLRVEPIFGAVWDPACGGGNIVKACWRHGLIATGTDIVDRGFGEVRDFLDPGAIFLGIDNIICNPPYFRAKGTEAFIRRALDVVEHKLCVFVDVKFLAGQARGKGLWRNAPPTRVWILSHRPSCPPGAYIAAGHKAENGTADWCWLVWDRAAAPSSTALGWLAPSSAPAAVCLEAAE